MSKTLIIAEKPSVARELARVLGVPARQGGGYMQGDKHVVSWALGHLVNIAEPEEQDPAWGGRWSLSRLPMIPARFKLTVLDSSARQYEVVRALMQRDDVTEILNATDAGREGELIFRRIYLKAECDKPVRRLWANDMTEAGLKKALANTMADEKKRNLGLAAFARAEADWLIGMNFSRLFTLKDGSLITVGRVQTPVLKLLVDRRREIENFEARDYWTVEAVLERGEDSFDALWHAPPEYTETRLDEETQAREVVEACTGVEGVVESVESKARQQKPPLPFDLTTLQREANSRFGLSAKDTLGIAQALYEQKKLITYPRTDSRYLTKELFDEVLGHLRAVYHLFPESAKAAAERIQAGGVKFACVNNKKVSDHHAIIPTAKKGSKEGLSADEWNVYEMICRRFCAAFMAPAKFSASVLWVAVGEHRFKATGKVFKDLGWLTAEPWRTAKDNPLPKLRKGSKVSARELGLKPHKTKPPAHYTDASLLAAMETAGKLVDDDELAEAMKERGLGTPATRAQVIETLLSRKYVDKDKKKLIASDAGCHAVDFVEGRLPHLVSPEMTGQWEKRLKDIEAGDDTYPAFMNDIRLSVRSGVATVGKAPSGSNLFGNKAVDRNGFPVGDTPPPPPSLPRQAVDRNGFPVVSAPTGRAPSPRPEPPKPLGESLGLCPICAGDVFEYKDDFHCAGSDERPCEFVIKKQLFGGEIRENLVRDLLAKGRTYRRTKFVSGKGKAYHANLKLNGAKVEISFDD